MSRRKLAIVVVAALAAGLLLALPTNAMAKYKTRLYGVTSQVSVDNTNTETVPTTPTVSYKLQKYVSGRWVSLSGTVKLYRYDAAGKQVYVTSKAASSGTFSLPSAGKYKLYYAGSTSYYSYTRYTSRVDMVVDKFTVNAEIASMEGDYATLKVTTDISWNTSATAAGATMGDLMFYGMFYHADPSLEENWDIEPMSFASFGQTLTKPGVYVSTVTLRMEDVMPFLGAYVDFSFDSPYFRAPDREPDLFELPTM